MTLFTIAKLKGENLASNNFWLIFFQKIHKFMSSFIVELRCSHHIENKLRIIMGKHTIYEVQLYGDAILIKNGFIKYLPTNKGDVLSSNS